MFDLALTFGGGACAAGISTVRGIAIYDTTTGYLLSAAANAGRTNAFLASFTKQ